MIDDIMATHSRELEAEAIRVHESLIRLKTRSIAMFAALAEEERNPYRKEFLLEQIEKMKAIAA